MENFPIKIFHVLNLVLVVEALRMAINALIIAKIKFLCLVFGAARDCQNILMIKISQSMVHKYICIYVCCTNVCIYMCIIEDICLLGGSFCRSLEYAYSYQQINASRDQLHSRHLVNLLFLYSF